MDFFTSSISPLAIELAIQTLRCGRVSEGARVREFEQALQSRLGLLHPVAVNSGTAALHLALVVAGVDAGDEVILPPQTFVASGLAILMQRAVPIFADIDPQTGNIAVNSIREKLTDRTKAIMPVHWAGYPCDLDEINALADEHGLAVIEDAAHALGASYQGQQIGSISRFTCFSFQAIKHLTTGDGGAIACRCEADKKQARNKRWFGIPRDSVNSELGERVYDLDSLGFKYHMNDLAAAIGLGNLADYPTRLAKLRQLATHFRQQLCGISGLTLLNYQMDRESAYWLFTVRVDRRRNLIRKLREREIPASVVHQRIDRLTIFGGIDNRLEGQSEFDAQQLSLPLHADTTAADVDRVSDVLRSGW